MVGFRTEDANFALELTANYGVHARMADVRRHEAVIVRRRPLCFFVLCHVDREQVVLPTSGQVQARVTSGGRQQSVSRSRLGRPLASFAVVGIPDEICFAEVFVTCTVTHQTRIQVTHAPHTQPSHTSV